MEEMLYKFIDEGRREHKEMGAFIRVFKTTNKLLLKERNNLLSELKFEVYGLSKAINDAQLSNYEVKGVTTRGGNTTTKIIRNTNDINKEPPILYHDKPVEPNEVLVETKPQDTKEQTVRPPTPLIPFPHILKKEKEEAQQQKATIKQSQEKLGLGEPKPTRMSLELANRSIQYLWGIVENVLIKIDKFILPIDFVILDMREDSKILIILGRPFLATARAMIDVFNKKITLRVRKEEESIDISDLESCGKADDSFESRTHIRRIEQVNMPYSESQETKNPDKTQNEHLYSASANEIKEKRPVLKDLPSHLEYAYLKGDESCP
ncbi:reverse transcriptase domain-containing protein, partial [Tanacetum coccineum]